MWDPHGVTNLKKHFYHIVDLAPVSGKRGQYNEK